MQYDSDGKSSVLTYSGPTAVDVYDTGRTVLSQLCSAVARAGAVKALSCDDQNFGALWFARSMRAEHRHLVTARGDGKRSPGDFYYFLFDFALTFRDPDSAMAKKGGLLLFPVAFQSSFLEATPRHDVRG